MIQDNQVKLDEITTSERVNVNSEIEGGTVDTVTEVANVTSVDTVDEVTNVTSVDTVDTVTEVTNITSVDTVDTVTESKTYAKTGDSTWQSPRLDSSTHAFEVIDYEHHEIHGGSSFVVSDVQNVDTTTMKWQITTPAGTKYAHVLFEAEGTGEISTVITEGSDRTDGTALAEINRNRVGTPTAATVIVTRTPTGGTTDGATTILSRRAGSTGVAGKTVAAGGTRGNNEFVLKPSTKYVVAVETFADIYVTFMVDFYEHTDKGV